MLSAKEKVRAARATPCELMVMAVMPIQPDWMRGAFEVAVCEGESFWEKPPGMGTCPLDRLLVLVRLMHSLLKEDPDCVVVSLPALPMGVAHDCSGAAVTCRATVQCEGLGRCNGTVIVRPLFGAFVRW